MPGEALPDAKIRIRFDTSDAIDDLERLEDRKERTERDRERKEETKDRRKRKAGEEKARAGTKVAAIGIQSRVMKILTTLGLVYGTAEFVELVLPSLTKWLVSKLPDEVLNMPNVGKYIRDLPQLAETLSDLVSDVKSYIPSAAASAKGAADAARAIAFLGPSPGVSFEQEEALSFAKRLFQITQALNRSERQQSKLSREVFITTFARMIAGGGS